MQRVQLQHHDFAWENSFQGAQCSHVLPPLYISGFGASHLVFLSQSFHLQHGCCIGGADLLTRKGTANARARWKLPHTHGRKHPASRFRVSRLCKVPGLKTATHPSQPEIPEHLPQLASSWLCQVCMQRAQIPGPVADSWPGGCRPSHIPLHFPQIFNSSSSSLPLQSRVRFRFPASACPSHSALTFASPTWSQKGETGDV